MQYAITENGERVLPAKGAKALCPGCSHPVLAACGDVYAEHWRHIGANPHCESWKEKETLWHRGWKARFPAHWREVAISKFGKRHIADVRTIQGTVIEFQNSSISVATIEAREDFYEDMIWVINTASIAGHIRTRSHVREALREVMIAYHGRMKRVKLAAEEDTAVQKKKGEAIKNKIGRLLSSKDFIVSDVKRKEAALMETETAITNAVASWIAGSYYRLYNITEPTDWETKYKMVLVELQGKKKRANASLMETTQYLAQLAGFERIYLEHKEYSLVPYSVLHKENLNRLRIVVSADRHSLFLTGQKVASMQELSRYQHQEQKYCFALDTSATKARFDANITANRNIVNQAAEEYNRLFNALRQEYKVLLQLSLAASKKQLLDTDTEIEEQIALLAAHELATERFLSFHDDALEKKYQQAERDYHNNRSAAMTENRGSYNFYWKYRRKSWDSSRAPKYLDQGNGTLLRIYDNGTMHKISVEDFLNQHFLV